MSSRKALGGMVAAMAAIADLSPVDDTYRLRPSPSFSTILGKGETRGGYGQIKHGGGKRRDRKKDARKQMAKASRKRNRR